MSSDFERWKRRRDAERAELAKAVDRQQAQREERWQPQESPPRDPDRPPLTEPPAAPAYHRLAPPRSRRLGCGGCLRNLLLLALVALLLLGGVGVLTWRAIENRGQVNVLLLGIDERPDEGDAFRSDTILLTGFDPVARQVALLSIPRDLWVTVPGHGEDRINTANFYGGSTLAAQTVRDNFGVPVAYTVTLNFDGFTALIDAMGGVTVDVPEALHDENYPTPDYGIRTIDIAAGEQLMDGETALIYARSRYSTSDFDRARRQQEIIGAVRAKLLQPRTWLRAPALIRTVGDVVRTDMPRAEWAILGAILLRSEIERTAIGPDMVQDWVTPNGGQVLLPIWEAINPILERYFE
ncbi:MAG: LCP family protein [Anaerolineales bacterium]|nr:LCP family protein [Anaerolineales bacterium]MCB9127243.1 LCP family protein [Ardenticatenales bacterium]MCB9172930.1 LCP family protein [Ardenticatenales bacterium]